MAFHNLFQVVFWGGFLQFMKKLPEVQALTNSNIRFDFPPQDLVCSTGDLAPVNLKAEWSKEEHCYDLEGKIYEKGDTLTSCSGCLEYTCTLEERDNCLYFKWSESVLRSSCCVDCDGLVFPPGKVMHTTQLNDTCLSVETERCEEYSKGKIFVARTVSPTTCCFNTSGLQPLKSSSVDPSTCSTQICEKTKRHPHAFWLVKKEYHGCDCCIYNGTLVPDGWSTPVNSFQNITCCKGDLQETFLPPLTDCHIQNLTYLIDTSGSMRNSRPIWEPVALELLENMVARQVDVVDYTLMDYVTTVQVTTTTSSNGVFYDAVDNMVVTGGGTELTFAGLLAALQLSPCHNFICVFTDEVGDDTTDSFLKSQILSLKAIKKSEIFFMVIPRTPNTLINMENNFADVGHVIDIKNNNDAVKDVVELMKASDICKDICIPTNGTTVPRPPAKQPNPWLTILRRGQYGNPVTMFSDKTFAQHEAGFGDTNKEFWAGLQKIAKATGKGVWELRVELVDFEENTYIAEYSNFKVEGIKKQYSLNVNGFKASSNLYDSLSYHNGMGFTTKDRDNDNWDKGNCAESHGGGAWWHNACFTSKLMGHNFNKENATYAYGIVWRNDANVPKHDLHFSWPFAEMKIRKSENTVKKQN